MSTLKTYDVIITEVIVHRASISASGLHEANAELLAALVDLLGDCPDIQSGSCVRCGRDYGGESELEGADCPSDDCPGYQARQLCARSKAGAL